MLSFEEAARLGVLVRVNDACCPQHGPITPEGLVFPLTVTGEALAFMAQDELTGPRCLGKGCESSILVDAIATDKRLVQHLVLARPQDFPEDYEHDKYSSTADQWHAMGFDGPRVITELPLIDGHHRSGTAVPDPEREWPDAAV